MFSGSDFYKLEHSWCVWKTLTVMRAGMKCTMFQLVSIISQMLPIYRYPCTLHSATFPALHGCTRTDTNRYLSIFDHFKEKSNTLFNTPNTNRSKIHCSILTISFRDSLKSPELDSLYNSMSRVAEITMVLISCGNISITLLCGETLGNCMTVGETVAQCCVASPEDHVNHNYNVHPMFFVMN